MTCARASTIRTTCPYCGVGCGVLATPKADGTVEIAGDPEHPANYGRLCSKGAALGETLSLEGRLLFPAVNGVRTSWDDALDLVGRRFREAIRDYGPDSVAIYGSGQLLTEDYYVANKLMKGFIGSANIDTNSRLCMASSVAGHKRAFGSDTVPVTYEDLELADLVVLVGSNLAWCHPVLFQRLVAAKEKRGTKIVVVDPRSTATCEIADLHVGLAPETDVALFNGLLAHLIEARAIDADYVAKHTTGFAEAAASAKRLEPAEVARTTGVTGRALAAFYDLFARTERVVTVFSQGVNQSVAGTDKVNAIINCHLATGRIGKPGAGPFSVTGQPNAMGGREVGGLANMLAAHMEIADPEHRHLVQTFWRSPAIATKPGLKAVDLFRAVGEGKIKALWILSTNPVVSMPEADKVAAALADCPFVVVSDAIERTDTTAFAHVLLPAAAWGEKNGTVTNSERRISRQRPFLAAPGEAKPDWWIISEIAKRMGFEADFAYAHPAGIFEEHARLTGAGNGGKRDLDISALAGITPADYDRLAPFQWPQPLDCGRTHETRFFADGIFHTPDKRARLIPTQYRPATVEARPGEYRLNTGRIRDQWHTMTRTAKTPRLMSHIAEPFVEIHPDDAAEAGVAEAALADVETSLGRMIVRVIVTARQHRNTVFVPMHWTRQLASQGRVCSLITADVDPHSAQPALKSSSATVRPFVASWYAFALTREKPIALASDYWAIAPAAKGWRIELAAREERQDWDGFARDLLGFPDESGAEILAYHDRAGGNWRFAAFEKDQLAGALFVSRKPVAVARSWAIEKLGAHFASARDRLGFLAGRSGSGEPDKGAIVCACFEVGVNQIMAARMAGCASVAAVGERLKAGTNCGSCRAEIGRLLHADRVAKAV